MDFTFAKELSFEIAKIGSINKQIPSVNKINPFQKFFNEDGKIKVDELDHDDEGLNRREILSRFLVLKVVLDQGPDMDGVDMLFRRVVNELYERNVRIFHCPTDFFKNMHICIDILEKHHRYVKDLRKHIWAEENNTNPEKYNLYFGQSARGVISINQVMQFLVARWGVPIALPLLLEKRKKTLVEYLEGWPSAEIMTLRLKDDQNYGLGRMIGNKACHLFAKGYVHTFNLVSNKKKHENWFDKSIKTKKGWDAYSYESPLDSNAGRVLFRTGWLQTWADLSDYENWEVIQRGKGKEDTDYVRVTNIRGKKAKKNVDEDDFLSNYGEIVTEHLKIKTSRWKKVEIQQIPNAFLLNTEYGIGDFDDGLMYIGTKYCKNHSNPKCKDCPINEKCKGYNENHEWIEDYRT